MPLLGREPFERKTLPEDIDPEDEVYFCKTTNEAFVTYDQFFERQILCSSMVWTCSITGRTGLTFEEALESERNANEMLTAFPTGLQLPVLYLMNYIKESKFGSVIDMICAFISNRYFIGEEIETIITGKKRLRGKVIGVIPPDLGNNEQSRDKNSSQTLSFGEDPTLYEYEIFHSEDVREVVPSERITRTKGLLTKDKVRLFLKQHLTAPKRFQPMVVKDSSKEEFNIETTEWSDIFAGPEPNFHDETTIVKTFNKDKQKAIRDSKHNVSDRSDGSHGSASKKTPSKSKSGSASNSTSSSKKSNNKTDSSKKKSTSSNKKLKDSSKKVDYKSSRIIATPEEKQRQREEAKLQKLEQKKLEKQLKKQFEENMKEWSAKRDDLACDDLQPLPNPIPIKCDIPTNLFGETLAVLEFLHNFNNLFDLRGIFPLGITFELMQQILYDRDVHGPYGDLIKVLLTSILNLQEEEDKYNLNYDKEETSDDEAPNEDEKIDKYVVLTGDKNANYHYCWIQQHLGQQLSQLTIDPFTITEILRLHLLSSGAGPKPRSKYRGLYRSREDPGIRFVIENRAILSKLESGSIFELNLEERVKIFQVLMHQTLAFVTFRDHIDNAFDEISKLKRKIRDIQTEFNKWNKENSLRRFQSEKNLNSDNVNNEADPIGENQSQTSGLTPKQLEEYKREKSRKEEEMLRSCSDVRAQIRKLQACYGLKPIGFDRAFRRYWLFESLPGLFVEHLIPDTLYTDMPLGPCLEEPTPVKSSKPNSLDEIQLQKVISNKKSSSQRALRDDSSTTSDKENEITTSSHESGDKAVNNVLKTSYLANLSVFDRCTANIETCSIHGSVNSDQRIEWSFYHTSEHLDALLSSLNNRGYRESELLFSLKQDRSVIVDLMSKCQPNKLNEDIPMPEVRKSQRLQEQLHLKGDKTFYSKLTSNIALEKALRDYLINMEERIYAASLGLVTEVSREEWRRLVESNSNNEQDLIQKFSHAILVLAQTIRPLCLTLPLSAENSSLDRWTESLKQCSSFSQLFVHLSILDHSIKWSKSALKAFCEICRRKCDAEYMLLCDKCNRGHHTYCLQPSLDSIPRGEWLCPKCCPKFKPQSPKKHKTKSAESDESDRDSNNGSDDEDSDDESENPNENESVSELSSGSSEEANNGSTSRDTTPCKEYDICGICNRMSSDLDLSCSKCLEFYHLSCAKLPRITRCWICPKCSSNDPQQRKRKQININDSDDSIQSETQSKRTKRLGRYSLDSDYVEEETTDDKEEKQLNDSTNRRRFDKSTAALRKSLPLDFSLCDDILRKLQRHEEGWLFRTKPKNNLAPNYNKIIKKYVDFGQLVSKLNTGDYRTNSEFFNDILLMFNNCEFYWPKNSYEYKSGAALFEYFQELLSEYDVDLTHESLFDQD